MTFAQDCFAAGYDSCQPSFTDAPVQAGSLIVVCAWWLATVRSITVTDSAGNTYTRVPRTAAVVHDIWYAYNVVGGNPLTITVTTSPLLNYNLTYAYAGEWTGEFLADPLVDYADATGASLAAPDYDFSAGSVTLPDTGCLVIGHFRSPIVDAIYPNTDEYVGAGYYCWICHRVQSSSGAYAATASAIGDGAWVADVAVFQERATWVDIPNWHAQEWIDAALYPGGSARCLCELWTEDLGSPGPTIQARLISLLTDDSVDAVVGTSAVIVSTTPTEATFSVTLSGRKRHKLQVTSDTTEVDLFCAPGAKVAP